MSYLPPPSDYNILLPPPLPHLWGFVSPFFDIALPLPHPSRLLAPHLSLSSSPLRLILQISWLAELSSAVSFSCTLSGYYGFHSKGAIRRHPHRPPPRPRGFPGHPVFCCMGQTGDLRVVGIWVGMDEAKSYNCCSGFAGKNRLNGAGDPMWWSTWWHLSVNFAEESYTTTGYSP